MDKFSKAKRSEIMSQVRNKNSFIEISLARALWHKGLRYRKNVSSMFGKPDLALQKYRTVIFVDSCFWHKCPIHRSLPATRKKFWYKKLDNNVERDKAVNSYYHDKGWHVFRVWEHDMKEVGELADRLAGEIKKNKV